MSPDRPHHPDESVPADQLPAPARAAVSALRDGLLDLAAGSDRPRPDPVAVWAYGAATFPEQPARLGDVDVHVILDGPIDDELAAELRRLEGALAERHGIEWDAWYITLAAARASDSPQHLLLPYRDHAWPLHRAHWLAGQYVHVHGRRPAGLVPSPSWPELRGALGWERTHIAGLIAEGRKDDHQAFMVLNACRILYSLATRNVVVSKMQAAEWGRRHLPAEWAPAIEAAGRAYDGAARPGDRAIFDTWVGPIVDRATDALEADRDPQAESSRRQ